MADAPIEVTCAGRTDAGVHATAQIVHFESPVARVPMAWVAGTNHFLPPDIRVRGAHAVPPDFHARFSAIARRYRYILLEDIVPPAMPAMTLTCINYSLDADAMHCAFQAVLGEHDFSAFRDSECQANHPVREVQKAVVTRVGKAVVIDVQANAFLHHMVRTLTGTLLEIGQAKKPVSWMSAVLSSRDRREAGANAPAEGLYLCGVLYPRDAGLTVPDPGPSHLLIDLPFAQGR